MCKGSELSMHRLIVSVTDYPFPDLEIERAELAAIGVELRAGQCKTEEEVIELVRDAAGVLNTYARITARVIKAMEKCRVIARYGIGVDNVDVAAASEKGIVVTNVPDYCIEEVSDHTMGCLLALERKLITLYRTVQSGRWSHAGHGPVFRLAGRVLGLVGFGRIAKRVAQKARGFGLKIMAYDPYLAPEDVRKAGAESVGLEELVREADYVCIHVPLTSETRGLFDERILGLMKPTSYIINTSRGGIIDEECLYAALKEGCIAGAALDVLAEEGETVETPLAELNNVILTPHAAFYSEEGVKEQQLKAVTQVIKVLTGRKPDYPVNVPRKA